NAVGDPGSPAKPAIPAKYDNKGNLIAPAVPPVPARPPRPGAVETFDQKAEEIKNSMMSGQSAYARARLERTFDSKTALYRGKLVNYALAQNEAAGKAISEANINSAMQGANLVTTTPVEDESGNLKPAITVAEGRVNNAI